jgi:uncharacterized protein (DUF58 family)
MLRVMQRPEVAMRSWAPAGRFLAAGTLARLALVGLASILAACGTASPTSPSEQGSLRLTASVNRSVIPAGEVATLTFRLENRASHTVTLNFSDSCQLMPYVASASGSIVYPPGGGWSCATVVTSLTLRPGESETREVKVGGVAQPLDSSVPLGAGEYSSFAKVPSNEYKLQSDPVRFTVQ